ncbi:phosphatidylinositol 3,4,5-trisphosphate 3-phosphatase and protein-tyrosine-phosphatase PTEN2A-like [Silene latifolia]|uniref:phosphatidylinositol 3,4,5-trisphosphate 3-phosphatase and protein-tyrosine-phosphatase PTEN2A-like n=1 Tax=Silene latifolia TaxID=37657 RepID=UPI003D772278
MESESADTSSAKPEKVSDMQSSSTATVSEEKSSENNSGSVTSPPAVSLWAKTLKLPQVTGEVQGENAAKSTFARFTSGFGLRFSGAAPVSDGGAPGENTSAQGGVLESLTKGLVDSSRGAVKAVQVKARHLVSQNKRRYQEGDFDLDLTYITDNIIAMGFPAGDMSSGLFGYVEGFYRNDMEDVIKFFNTRHQGKYKVYNLCSERLYDASLFQGKAASFPFDDHNCPPLHLVSSFCQSAYTWLKADIDNVVVVHCKAGLGRTGLMISSLLLFLKFCPTAEESIELFNQKRCVDGRGLVHPSQIRYVKYFERILTDYGGNNPPDRRCMLRGFRLHKCPYWIRPSITISNHNGILFTTKKHPKTKDLLPEDFWINSSRKGIAVFAIPGEPGLTELAGDFKIHFHDRHGDFYCWFNTTMTENKILVKSDDLDGFDKRKLPSPTFQVEIVMIDYDGKPLETPNSEGLKKGPGGSSSNTPSGNNDLPNSERSPEKENKDDVFSDSDGEEDGSSQTNQAQPAPVRHAADDASNSTQKIQQMTVSGSEQNSNRSGHLLKDQVIKSQLGQETPKAAAVETPDFKAIAADASVFTFGDDEDYESE